MKTTPMPRLPGSATSYLLVGCRIPLTCLSGVNEESLDVCIDRLALVDLEVLDGKVASVHPSGSQRWSVRTKVIHLNGKIVFPTFADLHTHIDKGHTTERSRNPDGSLSGADRSTAADANFWDLDDVMRRMDFSIRCAYAHGTSAVRTHLINMTNKQTELTWPAFSKLKAKWRGKVELQGVSLVVLSYYRDEEAAVALADLVAKHGGLLGAAVCCAEIGGDPDDDWTTCEKDRSQLLDRIFKLAKERDLDIDFHVDENPNVLARGLRYVSEKAVEHGYHGRVVCGHCCSLAFQPPDELQKTLDIAKKAGVTVVSLPLVNMWTQDRWSAAPLPDSVAGKSGACTRTPRWRGITLLHEVNAAGIPVAVASDNTRDQFYAYGDLDMLEVFGQSCRIGHLDRPYGDWPASVTHVPAAAMNLGPSTCRIAVGGSADFIIFRGRTYSELLARPQTDRVVVRKGVPIGVMPPPYEELDFIPGAIRSGEIPAVEVEYKEGEKADINTRIGKHAWDAAGRALGKTRKKGCISKEGRGKLGFTYRKIKNSKIKLAAIDSLAATPSQRANTLMTNLNSWAHRSSSGHQLDNISELQQMSPPDQGFHDILPMDSHSSLLTVSADEAQRKVVVLGIPWQTEDETLQRHFSKFGPIEVAQIMREKFSGKSRGFGFVTFVSTVDAATAVGSDHEIDGRRCEAKYALPEGRVGSARTTRIFVARIPSSVTDAQFRGYFEQFGPVQDAYMPKDPSKSGHRGIGFVTYATPESVEIVMASSHTLNGNEIAIDRATPKDTKGASGLLPGRLSMSHPNLSMLGGTSFTGGNAVFSSPSRPIGLPGSGVRYEPSQLGMGNRRMSFPVLANNNTTGNGAVAGSPPNPHAEVLSSHYQHPSAPLLNSLGQRYGNANASGSNININLLAAQAQMQAAALSGNNTFEPGSSPSQLMSILNANARMVSSLRSAGSLSHLTGGSAASSSSDLTAILAQHQQNQQEQWPAMKSMGSSGALASSAMGPASARAGPRIFVGKLNRETTEFDVKEYFIQFGYVMDVYLPRDKHNKREHRGFGFVTFETEASVQRVVAHGPHQIRGSIVAIDSAVPRQEEITVVMDSKTSSSSSMPPAFVPLSMTETEAQALQAMGALGLDGVVDHENKNGAEHHY